MDAPVRSISYISITETDSRVYFTFGLPALPVVMAYLLVYNISLPLAWPQRYRRLPRRMLSLADLMGQCHQARFLADPVFDISHPRSSNEKMNAWILLRENRYLFGWYLGRDGEQHLGFDVTETETGGPTSSVKWVPPKPNWVRAANRPPAFISRLFRRNGAKVVRSEDEESIEMQRSRTRLGADGEGLHRRYGDYFMHGALSSAVDV